MKTPKATWKKRDWTPVRRGNIYCSPACGGCCTWVNFQKATADAKKIAASLGPKWQPHVWENLGWHYEAKIGECSVGPSGKDRYWADLNADGLQFHADGTTARGAVETALREMEATAAAITAAAELLRKKGVQ